MVSNEELASVIEGETAVAHLATSVDDRPHAAPVWYGYDDGVVSILTAGKKLENVRENQKVALSIQRDDEGHREWMVLVRGTAEVVEDVERIHEAVRAVYPKYLGDDVDDWHPFYQDSLSDDPNVTLVEVPVGSAVVRAE